MTSDDDNDGDDSMQIAAVLSGRPLSLSIFQHGTATEEIEREVFLLTGRSKESLGSVIASPPRFVNYPGISLLVPSYETPPTSVGLAPLSDLHSTPCSRLLPCAKKTDKKVIEERRAFVTDLLHTNNP